ncbi:hypothetical protein [Aliikangiella sp. IMCC44359]|uniref:hypothetical protein n=1 Tax=Aliikangiella sp. IMCC44359 TaxID=3459125 RepID=UPI00403A7F4F
MNIEETADQIEIILRGAIEASSNYEAAPHNYCILFNPQLDERWVLVFLFKNSDKHRIALENGVCFWLHQYFTDCVSKDTKLNNLNSYVAFDSGELPENQEEYGQLHEKFVAELESLKNESVDGHVEICGLCEHDFNKHQMLGQAQGDEIAPSRGWMICPDKKCACFRTWSASYSDGDT